MILLGNCLDKLKELPDNSVDSVVTDPPYHLTSIVKRFGKEGSAPAKPGKDGSFRRLSGGFMGKTWDGVDETGMGIAFNPDMWAECLRVLKPGGHLLAFSGTRTYHRMAVAIEDAGFEVRDMVEWVYGSGFPKSLNIGKAVDKIQGNEREDLGVRDGATGKRVSKVYGDRPCLDDPDYQPHITKGISPWEGWGTALKPAHEPICLARKPIIGTVAQNVLTYGTGGLNIDKSRVGYKNETPPDLEHWKKTSGGWKNTSTNGVVPNDNTLGRFPANLLHDGSDEVVREFPNESERFFKSFVYCPKASKSERDRGCEGMEEKSSGAKGNGLGRMCEFCGASQLKPEECKCETKSWVNKQVKNNHPTVKPLAIMKYLIQMITPPGGTVLDPFAGSGSTLVAAKELGYDFIGIEMTEEYIPIIEARLSAAQVEKQGRLL